LFDTGVSNADAITRQLAPVVRVTLNTGSGGVVAGDVVRLLQGTTELNRYTLSAADIAQGWVDIQPQTSLSSSGHLGTTYSGTTALSASIQRLTATGIVNSATAELQTVTVDTLAPTAPSEPDLEIGDDRANPFTTGTNTDNLIRRANGFSFSGTVTAGINVVEVKLYANGVLMGSTGVAVNNAWSFTYPTTAIPLADGRYNITAQAVDATGNVSELSTALAINIDTRVSAPSGLSVVLNDDTGLKNDGVTNNRKPRITGMGEPGSTLRIFLDRNGNGRMDNGEELAIWYGSVVTGTGKFTLALLNDLPEGEHSLRVIQTDKAGNVSVASESVYIRIDTRAARPLGVALAPNQDNGLYQSDNIMSTTKPTFRVTLASDVSEGDTVQLRHYYSNSSAYIIATTRLSSLDVGRGWVDMTSTRALNGIYDGTVVGHGVFATVVDLAGNNSGLSVTRGNMPYLVIDRTAPTAPSSIRLLTEDDTGVANNDNVTSLATGFTIVGNLPGDENLRRIDLYAADVLIGSAAPTSVSNFRFPYDGAALAQGVDWLTVRVVDAAGNTSIASNPIQLVINASELTPIAQMGKIRLIDSSDTGLSKNDGVTRNTALQVTGMMQPGSTVQLFVDRDNDGEYSLGEAIGLPVTADATTGIFTTWTINLSAGTHVLRAFGYNATTGMPMGAMSERYTVIVKPGATDQPGIVELLASDDTSLVGDRITTVNTPTLRVVLPSGVVLGDLIRIYGTLASTTELFSVSVTQADITAGRADIKFPTTMPLPDGIYTFNATILDAAGNESQKSLIPYAVVIDTQGPSAPGAFTLAAASDSGLSNSDKITRQNTALTLTGTITPETVAVKIYDTINDPSQRELFDSDQFITSGYSGIGVSVHDVNGVTITSATLNGLGIGGETQAAVAQKAGTIDRWLFAMYDIEADVTRMVELALYKLSDGLLYGLITAAADRTGDHTFDASLINAAWGKPDATALIATSVASAGYGISRIEGSVTASKTILLGTVSGEDLAKSTF
jgi:hypothetical protein